MSTTSREGLLEFMNQAVERCIEHVEDGGLPFVGVLVDDSGMISDFGVNKVLETHDPTAHAEIVAMREVLEQHDREDLSGTALLATGEPCGLCYRFALDNGVKAIFVAVDRNAVAKWGFDYRASYPALGITETLRASVFNHLPAENGTEPFSRYLKKQDSHEH